MNHETERQDAARRRKADLAKVHIGKKALGMDDDAYRAMLRMVGGVDSAADLDGAGLSAVIRHMKGLGWRPGYKGAKRRTTPAKDDRRPMIGKVRAMLAAAGRGDEYADGIARRMFGVDRYEWLPYDQLHKLVTAMVYDAKRHGRKTQ